MPLNRSPSALPEADRTAVCAALNAALVDGLDIYTHFKLAHWNLRGPMFPSYHALFGEVADMLSGQADTVAERISTLGARVQATAAYVAKHSTIPAYEEATVKDMDHLWRLASRLDVYLASLRNARGTAAKHKDEDTANLLTDFILSTEKKGWFLRATLGQ